MAKRDDVASGEHIAEPTGTPAGSENAEPALPQGADLFRTLFFEHPDGVTLVVDGKIVLVNVRFSEMSGYSTKEAIGMAPREFVGSAERQRADNRIEALTAGSRQPPAEYAMVRKDGSSLAVDVHSKPIQHNGKPAILTVLRDVSEQRQAEEARTTSEDRYRRLLNAAPDGVVVVDGAGVIETVNTQTLELFGYTREELIGEPLEMLLPERFRGRHPDHRDAYAVAPYARQMSSASDLFGLRKDGSEFPVDISLNALQSGEQLSIIATVRDMSGAAKAEKALRDSEHRYRTLYELAGDAFLNVLPNGEVLDANVAAAELLGYTVEELKSIPQADDIIAPEVFEETVAAWRKQLLERGQFLVDTLWVRKDGSRVHVAVSGKPLMVGDQQQLQLIGRDITERKEAEIALRESEAINRAILVAMPDMIFRIARDGTYVGFVPGVAATPVVSPSELIGRNVRDILPDVADIVLEAIERTLMSHDTQTITYDVAFDDGLRSFETQISVYGKDEVLAMVRDITERKQAEAALQASEESLVKAQELAQIGSWSLDMTTRRVTWSKEMYRIFGLTEEQFDGSEESSTQSIHPDDLPKLEEAYAALFERHEPTPLEYRIVWPDGTHRVVYAQGDLDYDDQGTPVRLVGTVQDITERKQAEEALLESDARYRTLYEVASDAFLSVHVEGQIIDANVAAAEMLGYTLEELKELNALTDLVAPEVSEETMGALPKQLEERDHFRVDTLWVRKDGSRVQVAVSGKRLTIDGQDLLQLIARDVTERKEAEDALRESEATNQALLLAMPDMIFRVNRAGIHTGFFPGTANPHIPPSEFLGKNIRETVPSVAKQIMEAVEKALQSHETQTLTYDVATDEGVRSLETRVSVCGEDEVLLVVRDVTKEKQADEAIRALEEERYRRLLEVAPDGIVIVDEAGVIETVNAQTEELFGYDRKELIGKPMELLMPERNRQIHPSHRKAYTASPHPRAMGAEIDLFGVRKDGSLFPIDVSLNSMQTEDGIRIIASVRDITERMLAEKTLRESESRFSTAFHDNPVPVTITRIRDGKIIDLNDACLKMTGHRRSESIGRTAEELGLLENLDMLEDVAQAVREGETLQDYPNQIRRKTGELLEIVSTITQIDVDGEPCFLSTIIDITDRKRLEEELEKIRDDLETKVERRMEGGNPYKLTFREFTVLHLVADGKADKEIAVELGISIYTVHRHVSHILAKMDSPSRTEAGTRALREGLLE